MLDQEELNKHILPSLLKMDYDEIKSFLKINDVETILKMKKI